MKEANSILDLKLFLKVIFQTKWPENSKRLQAHKGTKQCAPESIENIKQRLEHMKDSERSNTV